MSLSAGPSDHDLVLLLRRRRPGAFEEVYRRYRERIWRFLVRLTNNQPVAEDLFQETWLAAARNAHRLHEATELLPWLFTIARNKHRNGLRAAAFDHRKRAALLVEPSNLPQDPDSDADARTRVERVAAALTRLPATYREVLLLCVSEGLDAETAAPILGLRADAVRKRLSRARAALAALVATPQVRKSEAVAFRLARSGESQ